MENLDPIILRLHQASIWPDIWPDVMLELSSKVFGDRPLMYGVQWLPAGMSFMQSVHIPTDIVQKIMSRYSSVSTNPMTRAAVPALKLHEPFPLDALIPPHEFQQTEYYKETIGQMGGVVGDLAVASHLAPTRLTVMVLARKAEQAPASDEHIEALSRLSPHLGLAMEVMVRMGRLSAAHQALGQVLCRVAQPVALLDSAGTIVFSNPALEDLLASGGILNIRAGRLHCSIREHDLRLQDFIAASSEHNLADRQERMLTIEPHDGSPGIGLVCQPIHSEFASNLDLGEARAIIFVSHLGSMRADLTAAFTTLFRLSDQQAAIVQLILDGRDGPTISEELSITPNTLKTHMQRIYDKTQTRSREELFKRLISVAAQMPRLEV